LRGVERVLEDRPLAARLRRGAASVDPWLLTPDCAERTKELVDRVAY
jgi:hypothetical protein